MDPKIIPSRLMASIPMRQCGRHRTNMLKKAKDISAAYHCVMYVYKYSGIYFIEPLKKDTKSFVLDSEYFDGKYIKLIDRE